MNTIKLQKLYLDYISLGEGINKNIAWAKYHNYRLKLYKNKLSFL